ncbi:MAG: hypothetical protein HUJ61_03015 [Bacilli bacterium]|nr:hypothetical protein [Bacilli bacterium]
MNIFYPFKKLIIVKNYQKKKKANPYNAYLSDSFSLKGDEPPLFNNSYFYSCYDVDSHFSLAIRLGVRNLDTYEAMLLLVHKDKFYYLEPTEFDKNICPLKTSYDEDTHLFSFEFNGELTNNNKETVNFNLNGIFYSRLEAFDFFFHSNAKCMAKAFAHQKWTNEFFDKVKAMDQVHQEQSGRIKGSLKINGESFDFDYPGIRDHSYGNRDWNYMDNHIWLLATNKEGKIFNFSFVNYPHLRNICVCYNDIDSDNNQEIASYNISSFDFNNGNGPDIFKFCAKYGKKKYHIEVKRNNDYVQHIDFGNKSYFFKEGLGEFIINGEPFYGSIEYGFNYDKSRWKI